MEYDVDTLINLLTSLNDKLAEHDDHGEIIIGGGAAIALAYGFRSSTKDIDGIFEPKARMQSYIEEVAEEQGADYDWLNDSMKGFLNPASMYTEPLYNFSNLTVEVADAETLLSMKLTSARTNMYSHDTEDAIALAQYLGVSTEDELFDIVERHAYPNQLTAQCNVRLCAA